jgi:hypothetical protein
MLFRLIRAEARWDESNLTDEFHTVESCRTPRGRPTSLCAAIADLCQAHAQATRFGRHQASLRKNKAANLSE